LDTEKKSLNALLEIMTLVASANNNGSYIEFILRGRPFIYIMNNRGPRIDPWGTPLPNHGKFFQHALFQLIYLNTPSVSLKAPFLVDIPFLKPYCSVTCLLLVGRCWLNLLYIVFSNTLGEKKKQ